MTEDEREHGSRAQGVLSVPLSAPRTVSVFYLKTGSCKHTQSWGWDDTVTWFHHLLLSHATWTMPCKKV